jgi:hypothetical protein
MNTNYRIEKDSMGELQVPGDALSTRLPPVHINGRLRYLKVITGSLF